MTIEEIKSLAQNRYNFLLERSNRAFAIGDIKDYDELSVQLEETRITLEKLNTL